MLRSADAPDVNTRRGCNRDGFCIWSASFKQSNPQEHMLFTTGTVNSVWVRTDCFEAQENQW